MLVDKVPTTRPLAFRHDMEKFRGDRGALHAAMIELLDAQTSPVARVHAGMALMCVGHPRGAEVLLSTLRTVGAAQQHALGELNSIWGYDLTAWAGDKPKLPVSAAEVAKTLTPLLDTPETKEGSLALEFCLRHACATAAPFVVRHLAHPDVDVRWKVVCAFLLHGIDEGALAAVAGHCLGPVPAAPEALGKWRRVGEFYGAHLVRAMEHEAFRPAIGRLALDVVRATLNLPDAALRTWFNVDHRTGAGGFNHMLALLGKFKSPEAIEALKAVVIAAHVAPTSRAKAAQFAFDASGAVPAGSEPALVAMVKDTSVSECGREAVLRTCASALGLQATSGLILALEDADLRAVAAQGLEAMPESGRDPEILAALERALRAETRDWVAAHIADALMKRGAQSDETVAALMPWDAMDARWAQQGITRQHVVHELTAAGAMDAIDEAELDAAASGRGESLILNLLTQGDPSRHRMVLCDVEDHDTAGHDELFAQLANIARPPLQIESLSQSLRTVRVEREATSAGLRMWQDGEWKAAPEALLGDTKLVSIEEGHCTVSYVHAGAECSFEVDSSGFCLDVDGVVRAFNQLLERVGRPDRAFRLKGPGGDDRFALLLCAHGTRFPDVAKRLHIPLLATGGPECRQG